MPTYVYETIPSKKGDEPHRFEIRQSMRDAALTHHPDTGEPVKRVISGGYGILGKSAPAAAAAPGSSCCRGGGCGCH